MTDRSSYIDLLPCPFCGNPPFVDDDRDGVCTITCATDSCIGVEITCPTRDHAAGFWNTRAPTRSPEWQAGQQRIHDREKPDHAVYEMHKGGES